LCNIPTGISERELVTEISKLMVNNFLNDPGNSKPLIFALLNEKDQAAILELSSVEEANRLLKVNSI
jgi:polo-like kinase 1